MEINGTRVVWTAFNRGDRGGSQPLCYNLQSLFRIPLRVYALLVAIAYDVHDLLLLGGPRGFVLVVDLLAGDFRSIIDDQKSEMGVACDDRFRAGTDVFNLHDLGYHYPLD